MMLGQRALRDPRSCDGGRAPIVYSYSYRYSVRLQLYRAWYELVAKERYRSGNGTRIEILARSTCSY